MIDVNTTSVDTTIVNELAGGALTVKELMVLTGKAETTVRNVLKGLIDGSIVTKVEDSKPAAYTVISPDFVAAIDEVEVTEVEVDEAPTDEVVDEAPTTEPSLDDEADAEAEAKLDELVSAIAAIEPAPKPAVKKVKKSKKVGQTQVPDEENETVTVDGAPMFVTDAYAFLIDPPKFNDIDVVFTAALEAQGRTEGDHTAEEVTALYYVTVAAYLENLLDEGTVTRQVWYGRTCRLRHLVIGHGRGTALAKPVVKTKDK